VVGQLLDAGGRLVTAALVTAIYGDYDALQPLPDTHGFDRAICVTDNPGLEAAGWEVLCKPTGEAPILAAKLPKMRPFDFVTEDVAVWLDGSFIVKDRGWRDFCVNAVEGVDLVAWPHPDTRGCLYKEAAFCDWWPRYQPYPIREQVEHYRSEGMPEGFGLWACGGLVWRNSDGAKAFGEAWLQEQYAWSIQDQVSFPYLLWKLKPRFRAFPAHQFLNPYLDYVGHK
jgi:hypothetical protein